MPNLRQRLSLRPISNLAKNERFCAASSADEQASGKGDHELKRINVKKYISLLLALSLAAVLSSGCGSAQKNEGQEPEKEVTVTAQEEPGEEAPDETVPQDETGTETADESSQESGYRKTDAEWDFPQTGFVLKVPESFKNLKGQVIPMDRGEISIGAGIFIGDLLYLARTDEEKAEAEALYGSYNDENDPDGSKRNEVSNSYYEAGLLDLFYVIGCRDDIGLEGVLAQLGTNKEELSTYGELGQAGEYKYYYFVMDYSGLEDQVREVMTEEFYPECEALLADAQNIAAGITVKEPQEMKSGVEVGKKLSFETKDLDGNTVTSEELFAGHKVTMINIWATWCGPCKNELAQLESLNQTLAVSGCQIIGICDDTTDGDQIIAEAKKILEERGVRYVNLQQTPEIRNQVPPLAFPTTYFVDSEGRILTEPVVGAYFDQYAKRIEEALGLTGK